MDDRLKQTLDEICQTAMIQGFNRALNALDEVGAIDRTEMKKHYKGVGSKYYNIVTEQFELTMEFARLRIEEALDDVKMTDE